MKKVYQQLMWITQKSFILILQKLYIFLYNKSKKYIL